MLGIGTDIVQVCRFERILNRTTITSLSRIFTDNELEYCFSKKDERRIAESLSSKFAAKEAFVKALGIGFRYGIYPKTIEILNDNLGKPYFVLNDFLIDKIMNIKSLKSNNITAYLSISCDYLVAVCFVLITMD